MTPPYRVSLPLALLALACGGSSPASAPTASAPASPGAPTSAASAEPAPTASASADPPRRRRPLEIKNACAEIVTVAFGEDPKAADAGRRQIAAESSIEGPRDAEGNLTVWLLDAKGEPLVKVHVTRGMKRVEVGRSCRALDAR